MLVTLALGFASLSACSSDPGTPEPSGPARDMLVAVPGVSVQQIAVYQGLKRPLMVDGAPANSDIPVVSGRDALIRVFIKVDEQYEPKTTIVGRLYIEGEDEPVETSSIFDGPLASFDNVLSSTINFNVPGKLIKPDAKYRLELGKPVPFPASALPFYYPEKGYEALPVDPANAVLKLRLVPVQYKADGSNRVPNTSADQVKAYADAFRSMYPIADIQIDVREPLPWGQVIAPNGQGWDTLLDRIATIREQDMAPADMYYYGIFNPAESASSYCSQGCVAGLGFTGGVNDSWGRAAIGLGYEGFDNIATETALHEVGHNHGRYHAPCQVGDPDPAFPYPGGKIGVWGYDRMSAKLFEPTVADVMGYCTPIWISDYTYNALFKRIKAVSSSARRIIPPELQNRSYARAIVDGKGNIKWLPSLTLRTPPDAEAKEVVLETAAGEETREGQFYPFDHLDGGVLFFPAPEHDYKAIRFALAGKSLRLKR